MKCPHCDYEHDPDGSFYDDNDKYVEGVLGEHGGFYKMPVKMERMRSSNEYYYDYDTTLSLYACPSCMKTFVE
jgi:hypothetical protein